MATMHTSKETWRYTPLKNYRFDDFAEVSADQTSYQLPTDVKNLMKTEAGADLVCFYNGQLLASESKLSFVEVAGDTMTVTAKGEHRLRVVHLYGSLKEVATQSPFVVQPKHLYKIAAGAKLEITETHLAANSLRFHVNNTSAWNLEDGAEVSMAQTFWLGEEALVFNKVTVAVAQKARFQQVNLSIGSELIRHYVSVNLNGPAAECELNSLVLARGKNHVDTYSRVSHLKGETRSQQLAKSVLNGQSKVIFTGELFIAQDAQKSDANQLSQSLLLSRQAEADTRPQLQVDADDVKATHGATVGQLDEGELFYLMSRGISREEARHVLALGYQKEVLEKIEAKFVKSHVEAIYSQVPPEFTSELSLKGEA